MNETIKNIMERRSVRGYDSGRLPEKEKLDAVLQAALWAPSAVNEQPCHMTVVTDVNVIKYIDDSTKKYLGDESKKRLIERCKSEDFSIFYGAPCVFVISCNQKLKSYNDIDVGVTIENICISAQSVGLSTCIIGMSAMMFDKPECEDLIKKIELPENYHPRIVVAVGYKNLDSAPHPRKENRSKFV